MRAMTLTAGKAGATVFDGEGSRHVPSPTVTAVDATGAGDGFAAADLASILEGRPIVEGVAEGVVWGQAGEFGELTRRSWAIQQQEIECFIVCRMNPHFGGNGLAQHHRICRTDSKLCLQFLNKLRSRA